MMEDCNELSILAVNFDYKMCNFKENFDFIEGSDIYQPVIRVFGSTDLGQRACLHIHGFLPYIYFRPENMYHPSFKTKSDVSNLLESLSDTLEELLHFHREQQFHQFNAHSINGRSSSYCRRRHIKELEMAVRKTFYGMFVEEFVFIKAILFNPSDMRLLAQILEDGLINGIKMQAYEAHIPYLLKFTSDMNIAPMNWIELEYAKFRPPLPSDEPLFSPPVSAADESATPSKTNRKDSNTEVATSLSVNPKIFESPFKLRPENVPSSSYNFSFTRFSADSKTGILHETSPYPSRGNLCSEGTRQSPFLKRHRLTQSTVPREYIWSDEEVRSAKKQPRGPEDRSYLDIIVADRLHFSQEDLSQKGSQENQSTPKAISSQVSLLKSPLEPKTPDPPTNLHRERPSHLTTPEYREVMSILNGLSEEDLEFHLTPVASTSLAQNTPLSSVLHHSHQEEAIGSLGPVSANVGHAEKDPAAKEESRAQSLLDRMSCCEIEMDTHVRFIANQKRPSSGFGAELWAEERLRCQRKKMSQDVAITPPYTQTTVRTQQEAEKDFHGRFERLRRKGSRLMQCVDQRLDKKPDPIEKAALSQFLLSPTEKGMAGGRKTMNPPSLDAQTFRLEQTHDLVESQQPPDPVDEDLDAWVEDQIEEAIGQVCLSTQVGEAGLQGMMSPNIQNNHVEQYLRSSQLFKSQEVMLLPFSMTSPDAHPIGERLSGSRGSERDDLMMRQSGEEDENEEGNVANELEDILQSTQADVQAGSAQSKAKPSRDQLDQASAINVDSCVTKEHQEPIRMPHSFASKPPLHPNSTPYPARSSLDAASTQIEGLGDDPAASLMPHGKSSILKKRSFQGKSIALAFQVKKPRKIAFESEPPLLYGHTTNPSSSSDQKEAFRDGSSDRKVLQLVNETRIKPRGSHQGDCSTWSPLKPTQKTVSFVLYPPDDKESESRNIDLERLKSPCGNSSALPSLARGDISLQHQDHLRTKRLQGSSILRLRPAFSPPTLAELSPMHIYGLEDVVHVKAFYSRLSDFQLAQTFKSDPLVKRHVQRGQNFLEPFDGGFPTGEPSSWERILSYDHIPSPSQSARCLLPSFAPPDPRTLWNESSPSESLPTKASKRLLGKNSWNNSQIHSPTQTPKASNQSEDSNLDIGKASEINKKSNRLTLLSLEVFCKTRKDLLPNPKFDEVCLVAWVVDDIIRDAETEVSQRLVGYILHDGHHQNLSSEATSIPVEAHSDTEVRPYTPEKLENCPSNRQKKSLKDGHCVTASQKRLHMAGMPREAFVQHVASETELYYTLIQTIQNIDPDILVGYELQNESFGYLVHRGQEIQIDMLQALSRVPDEKASFRNVLSKQNSEEGLDYNENNSLFIAGRIVLNNWVLMKAELKLSNNSLQHVARQVLSMRVPYFSDFLLTRWFKNTATRPRVIRYVYRKALLNLLLIEKLDLVRKTSECARLYGIDFYSVLNRGSQYRVEAALLIRAHQEDYILISPSKRQVASQAAMEVIPLVMEPESNFYVDPILVLDFQSLYPSMVIAYNLCFSTIFGKLRPGQGASIDASFHDCYPGSGHSTNQETTGRLGVIEYSEATAALNATLATDASPDNSSYVSPNGSLFCGKGVRHGILPRMLKEMLDTRVMLKRAMKRHSGPGSQVLQRVLDARQLAIKLLANVTYGYTAAGFSGRMPMAELADAIVQSGRSTLEWTIRCIESNPEWRAKVVYGDTDSVFVLLKGRSLSEAFRLGNEMVQSITANSPKDVYLKFEKVYLPSILVTKKRYVGYSFEHKDQKEPHLDAKGVEIVRRDQCPATIKMQEKAVRLLFETKDLSQVKDFLFSQWSKMLAGGDKLLLKDFIFSKEVRFGRYASVSSQPPGAIVATKAVLYDEMAIPPYNWRVPYVVVNGVPNAPLKNLVYSPEEVLRRGSSLRLNYNYYINKCIIPALDRLLSLCGIDVLSWFRAMPKPKLRLRHINYDRFADKSSSSTSRVIGLPSNNSKSKQLSMDRYTTRALCELCGDDAYPQRGLCIKCLQNQAESYSLLSNRLICTQKKELDLSLLCRECAGHPQPALLYQKDEMIGPGCCSSLDCIVFYERARLVTRIEDFSSSVQDIEDIEDLEGLVSTVQLGTNPSLP